MWMTFAILLWIGSMFLHGDIRNTYLIMACLMVIAHEIEYLAIQVKNKKNDQENK